MSYFDIWSLRQRINKMGAWAGIRFLRNQGYQFEDAYYIMFNRHPLR